ncbi:hypothetical protein THIOM_001455 [Candidatus Thiomargarita nelsonii]|uniref:Uncharacterized protein n=1 Tax=Candidatus Thiomargarita nelsonii TaxID=1003181 RepID=A0A176S4B7_9GAMM|nr:hypothetical protein THIOM_001455 [Candidatus Thiomargarita nelsonii]
MLIRRIHHRHRCRRLWTFTFGCQGGGHFYVSSIITGGTISNRILSRFCQYMKFM